MGVAVLCWDPSGIARALAIDSHPIASHDSTHICPRSAEREVVSDLTAVFVHFAELFNGFHDGFVLTCACIGVLGI
jgi:hypothetical protein